MSRDEFCKISLPSGESSRVEVRESRVKRGKSRVRVSKVSSKLSVSNLQFKSNYHVCDMIAIFPRNSSVKGGEICYGFMLILDYHIVIFFDAID